MQAGCCSAVIEKLADYFIAIGYWNLEQEMQQMKKVDVMHDGCFVIAQDFSVLIAIAQTDIKWNSRKQIMHWKM